VVALVEVVAGKAMLILQEEQLVLAVQLDLFGARVEFIQIMYLMFKE